MLRAGAIHAMQPLSHAPIALLLLPALARTVPGFRYVVRVSVCHGVCRRTICTSARERSDSALAMACDGEESVERTRRRRCESTTVPQKINCDTEPDQTPARDCRRALRQYAASHCLPFGAWPVQHTYHLHIVRKHLFSSDEHTVQQSHNHQAPFPAPCALRASPTPLYLGFS